MIYVGYIDFISVKFIRISRINKQKERINKQSLFFMNYFALSSIPNIQSVYLVNFIMQGEESSETPQFSLSFMREARQLSLQQRRLSFQILRVQAVQKLRSIQNIWLMTQAELVDFFSNYQLLPQQTFTLQDLLAHLDLKLVKNQGKIFFGLVKNRKRQGAGISVSREGKVYQGEYEKNQKNGKGIQIYPNGNLYIGDFSAGKKHGSGRFFWFNLSPAGNARQQFVEHYEGQWWGGLPDGFGTHQKINGDLYSGCFKNGLKHGEGTELYGNGDFYKGQFVNGHAQGYGEYTWADGSFFKGDFQQGKRSGYGVWQAGKNSIESYKGHFHLDMKAGYGVYTWQNGWSYRGNFESDTRHGYGELYQADNFLNYRGFWDKGQQVGQENPLQADKTKLQKQSSTKSGNQQGMRNTHPIKNTKDKQQLIQLFSIKKKALSSNRIAQIEAFQTPNKSNSKDLALARRPWSTNGKKVRRACSINVSSTQKSRKPSEKTSTAAPSQQRVFIGTIKSNLFVPGRYSSKVQ